MDSKESLFKREILTVGQLTARVKTLLENGIGSIWLAGEISNLRRPGSGHYYMTLKDSGAQIRGVLFRTKQRYLGFEPEDGQEVLVRGRISVYEPRGEYQILIEFMEPRGAGALQLAFERLKEKLAAEGLFDEKLKKKLPYLPGRVAVITSPTGAAIRDFVRVARRRYENVAISIYPVRVQGTEAAGEIVEALETLNRTGGFEVIVLTRGGGSLEDLWPFNEEIVARAVAASGIPVVSAVGHEVDFTISDFVSDLRAPTPSAAAELVFREKKELQNYFYGIRRRLWAAAGSRIRWHSERLAHLQTRLGAPQRLLSNPRQRLDDLTEGLVQATASRIEFLGRRLESARARLAPANPRTRLKSDRAHLSMLERSLVRSGRNVVAEARSRLSGSAARLSALSPLSVLGRGYALVRKGPDGPPLRSSRDTAVGEKLNVLLAQGALAVSVEEVEE